MGTTYILGAGPNGLAAVVALQQGTTGDIVVFEKRPAYTRDRKVTLSHFLLADGIDDFTGEGVDADDIRAVFRHEDLEELLTSKRAIPREIRDLLSDIGPSFVPLNTIERALADIMARGRPVDLRQQEVTFDLLASIVRPGDVVLDATGRNSVLRDRLTGTDNTLEFIVEHAIVVSLVIDSDHTCTTDCMWSGSIGNDVYDFIPSVRRSHTMTGKKVVVGIVEIGEEVYDRLPRSIDAEWLTTDDPAAQGIRRYLDHHAAIAAISVLSIMTLPLNLYCARHFTNAQSRRLGDVPDVSVLLLGDAAIGSPYFQSISLGLESTFLLTWLLAGSESAQGPLLEYYESFMERQWMRVYMRSRAIKANKDVLSYVDDIPGLLDILYVY